MPTGGAGAPGGLVGRTPCCFLPRWVLLNHRLLSDVLLVWVRPFNARPGATAPPSHADLWWLRGLLGMRFAGAPAGAYALLAGWGLRDATRIITYVLRRNGRCAKGAGGCRRVLRPLDRRRLGGAGLAAGAQLGSSVTAPISLPGLPARPPAACMNGGARTQRRARRAREGGWSVRVQC